MQKTLCTLAVAAILAAGTTQVVAESRKDLMMAVTGLTKHLDPMGQNANVNERISQNVLENLIFWDFENGGFKPGLAESWRMLDDTTMELTLRSGVMCHNGEDFTAEDVAIMFGPERFNGEAAPGWPIARSFLGIIESVKAIDPTTVHIKTRSPDPLLEHRLASWMGQVPCADAYREAANWESWGTAVVGTGPYRVAEVRPAELQRFEAFDGYWGGTPPLQSFTLKIVPEMANRVSGLLTGEFDMITEITPDQFDTIESSPDARVEGGPIRNIRVVLYDKSDPVLADPRIRRAMNMAIDRELIVKTLFGGKTTVPHGLQMKSFGDMFVEDHQPANFDPDAARKLIEETGYDGRPFTYRYVNDYYTAEVATAQILQQMWKDVGLNVQLDMKESWDPITGKNPEPGRAVLNLSNAAYYPDPLGQLFRLYGKGGYVPTRNIWSNAEFDGLQDELLSLDHPTRKQAFARLLEIYEQDPPGTFLHVLPMFYGVRADVEWTAKDTAFMDFRPGKISTQ